MAVAPGFIDVHEHTSVELLVNPKAESAVRQGVTTLVSGNCGDSIFPLTESMAEEAGRTLLADYGLDLNWKDAGGFFDRLGGSGMAFGHDGAILGEDDAELAQGELAEMDDVVVVHLPIGGAVLHHRRDDGASGRDDASQPERREKQWSWQNWNSPDGRPGNGQP